MLCILELYHYGEFTSDISAKCELFNWYFGDQCVLFANNSQLWTSFVFSFDFSVDCIGNIKKLGSNKDHGHDMT